jgi:hypothetical protein
MPSAKIWNLKYHLGNTGRVMDSSENPMLRAAAMEAAGVVSANGWRAWVEHRRSGVRIFESPTEMAAQKVANTAIQ